MRKPVVIGAAVLGVAVLLGVGGAYAYFFSGLRSTPKPLALSSGTGSAGATASPGPTASAAATAGAGLAGTWRVGTGSLAGYRVREQFAGQTAAHDAVARTSTVSGSLTVADDGSGLTATGLQFTVRLADLQSVDTVAGLNVANRDRIVSRTLSVSQYPDATFQAQSVVVPADLDSGQTPALTIPGQLTVHGVTKPVTVSVQLRLSGGQVQAAGSTSFAMTDFGVQPPQVPITVVQPQVTVEFQLVLVRG
jgi:polyisoprenoid-binding protein YceI